MTKAKCLTLRDEPFPTQKNTPELQDAKEYLFWDQTAEDRAGAVQMHENHCQIAEAIKRSHPEADQVWVKSSRLAIRFKDGIVKRWVIPTELRSKIRAFDQGGRLQDGSYYALPPSPSITQEALAKMSADHKRSYKEGRKTKQHPGYARTKATR